MKISFIMHFFLAALLLECSVNIEDPIQDTQTKINEDIPAKPALLVGRWIGKSTISGQSTPQINLSNVTLDFLHDGTFLLEDTEGLVFTEAKKGPISLSNNTLTLYNVLGQPAMKFRIALSFQGNYLKLIDENTKKTSFFVRQVLPKKKDWPDTLLAKGERVWEYRGWRHKTSDEIRPSTLQGDFFYIRFEKSSLLVETNQNGIVDSTFPGWELHSDTLYLTRGKVEKYIMDFYNTDSLVLWPLDGISHLRIAGLNAGSLDFIIYTLTSTRHSN